MNITINFILKVIFFFCVVHIGYQTYEYIKNKYTVPVHRKRVSNELDQYKKIIETIQTPDVENTTGTGSGGHMEDDLVAFMNTETQKLMNQV